MNKSRYLTLALCGFAVAAVVLPASRHLAQNRVYGAYKTDTHAQVSALERSLRPNYPFSVIPGGAYTPAELRSALARDEKLRQHYADFDLDKLRLVKLLEDRRAYVSYRQEGRFYWTRHKLRIARGEVLLTDGVHYAKTRCGNLLSDVPAGPVAQSDKAEAALSPAPLELRDLSELTFLPSPVSGPATPAAAPGSIAAGGSELVRSPFVPALPGEVASTVFGSPANSGAESSNLGGSGGPPATRRSLAGTVPPALGLPPVPSVPTVPEPADLLLFGSALILLSRFRRAKGGGNRFQP